MNEDSKPTPEPPTEWIAPLVRTIMSSPRISGTDDLIKCPVCECDHQQFLGLGVFHPSADGTKLITTFPTAQTISTIDLPPDIKVGSDIHYVRYKCLCGGHHWAELQAWHHDHAYRWRVQVGIEPVPGNGHTVVPPQVGQPHSVTPIHTGEGLGSYVKSMASHPLLSSLNGGLPVPILVLPIPMLMPAPVQAGGLPKPAVQAATPPPCDDPATVQSVIKSFQASPKVAGAWWTSWGKEIVSQTTQVSMPKLPSSKKTHFYVADADAPAVDLRKDWIMNFALDMPKDIAAHVWAYLLWHSRLVVVLRESTVTPVEQALITKALYAAAKSHSEIRLRAVGMYLRKDYIKLSQEDGE